MHGFRSKRSQQSTAVVVHAYLMKESVVQNLLLLQVPPPLRCLKLQMSKL